MTAIRRVKSHLRKRAVSNGRNHSAKRLVSPESACGPGAFFTARQVARLWRADLANTRRRLKKLNKAGLIETRCIVAQPPPEDIAVPLCAWRLGDPLPHPGKVSWAAKKRYCSRPLRRMTAFIATEQTRLRFGSFTGPASWKSHQSSHDLSVGALWVAYALRWPRIAARWLGEDMFSAKRDGMVEDAMIVIDGKPLLGIEVGHYRKDRFEKRFHDFVTRQLSFRCH